MDSWHDNEDEDGDDELSGDPAFGGKDAIIFIIDASSDGMHVGNDGDDSPFIMALKSVHATLRRKILGSPADVVGLLLAGTERKFGVRDFDHLSLVLPLSIPEAKAIIRLEDIVENASGCLKADVGSMDAPWAVHEALWQCQSLFNDVAGKVGLKKVILLTSNDDPHTADAALKRQAIKKAADLSDSGIVFEVIPLGVDKFDWSLFYGDMVTKAGEEATEEAGPQQQLADLLRLVRKRVHKKRTVSRCYFDLGGGVKVGVATYNFVQRAVKPPKVRLTRDTNEEVRIQRQFINPTTGGPLLPADIDKFMEHGGKWIQFSQDEVRAMQKSLMGGSFGLKLLAFRPASELKMCDFVRSSHFIYPDEGLVKGSRNLLAALLIKCVERDVVAICAYKARATSAPTFVALHAQSEEIDASGAQKTPAGFLAVYLPFADDFRDVPEDVSFVESTEEQKAVARAVIKKMKMRNYEPEAFENPSLQAHFKLVEALALQREDVEDDGLGDMTLPSIERLEERLGDRSQAFLDVFAVERERRREDDGDNNFSADMATVARQKRVEKLKVDELKGFLKAAGVVVTGKKKAELVADVYAQFT